MLLLEVIANFRRAKVLKRLYKCGLLDVLRTWLSTEETPEAEALTDVVLTFLKEQWITKALISAYDFGIGKAIVKVKKSGSESNRALAEEVQKQWTDILNGKEKNAVPESALPPPAMPSSKGVISLPTSLVPSVAFPRSDAIALNTRSRRPIVLDDELDYRKRLRMTSHVDSLPMLNPRRTRILPTWMSWNATRCCGRCTAAALTSEWVRLGELRCRVDSWSVVTSRSDSERK